MNASPLVSIVCTAYQHKKFIKEALDGFLMQQTTFPYEVVVHDDASSDGTAKIIRDYAERFPDIIRPIFQTVNQFSREPGRVTRIVHAAARGRYVALCEGDDYWTDPLKLQKQVDFLEDHPLYSMCFHRAILKKGSELEPHPIPETVNMDDVRFADLLEGANFIATASVVYRNELMPLPSWFSKLPFGDLGLHFLISRKGKIKCLDAFMSVYRIHGGGVWTGRSRAAQLEGWLRFFDLVWPLFTPEERAIVKQLRKSALDHFAHDRYPVNPRRMKVYRYYIGGLFALRGHV